jgi:hypothetical protein
MTNFSVAELSPDERLVWLLGDLMNAVENYFGAENPKRSGHIYHAAIRIMDEVIAKHVAQARAEAHKELARMFDSWPHLLSGKEAADAIRSLAARPAEEKGK